MDRFADPIRSLLLATDERAAHLAVDAPSPGVLLEPGVLPQPSIATTPQTITSPGAGTSDGFAEMIAYGDGFLCAWNRAQASGPLGVLAQRFDVDGHAIGAPITIEPAAIGIGGKPELVALDNGKVAIFWIGASESLKGAILDPVSGTLSNVTTVLTSAADWMHDVIRLDNGDIAMLTMGADGADGDIDLIVLNDANLATVRQTRIDTFAAATQTYDHTICSLGAGGVAVYRDRDTNELFAQKFTGAGALSGDALKINTTAINLPTTFDITYFAPQATELSGGGYVVTWMNVEGSGGDRVEVRGRVFDAAGNATGADFLVNPTPAGNQYDAQVVALAGGDFAVLYVSDVGFTRTTMVRYFDAQGHALTGEIATNAPSIFTTSVDHQITVLADGTIVDLYPEGGFTSLTIDGIHQPQFGTDGADTLTGTASDDVILAGAGNDRISVKAGGADLVNGQDGDDQIDLGASFTLQDSIDGGAGADTVLLDGDYNLTFAANLVNVEKIALGGGHDYTFVLSDAMTAAGKLLAVDGSDLGSGDVLHVFGYPELDGKLALTGGAGDDELWGGSGADSLSGGAGDDILNITYGGNDAVKGGDGDDTIQAGTALTASDKIDGGKGIDVLLFQGASTITLGAKTIVDVETIRFAAGASYALVMDNGNLGTGKVMTIDASALSAANGLVFNGSAEANGKFVVLGGAGDDSLTGGGGADRLAGGEGTNRYDISAGGKDIVTSGSGGDSVLAGGAFDAKDKLDGGGGFDGITLNGDYHAGLHFKTATMKNFESMTLAGGHDYKLFFDDGNVAAGVQFNISANTLGAGDSLYLDGSHETDGSFNVIAGGGDDTLIGGTGNDSFFAGNGHNVFDLTRGGDDGASGGFDDDLFKLGAAFTANDHIDGGGGDDTVLLSGDYAERISFNSQTMHGVEHIQLASGHDYNLQVTVDANTTITIDGSALKATDQMIIDKNAQGIFTHAVLLGGAGDDSLTGGDASDTLHGGGGADTLAGGAGGLGDTFVYTATSDSTSGSMDVITDLDFDTIDLSAIDADTTQGGDQAFTNVGAAFTGHAGELRIFLSSGNTFVELDTDGDSQADSVIEITGDHTTFNNFVL